MTFEHYTITLDKDLVNEAKELVKDVGGRLSPILNRLLKEWIEKTKIKR